MGPPRVTGGRGLTSEAMETGDGGNGEVMDNCNNWCDKILGLDKRKLLEEMLPLVASNLSLQRLYSEFRCQLDLTKSDSVDLFK